MNNYFKTAIAAATLVLGSHAMAQITFYEGEGYRGRAITANGPVTDLSRTKGGFNDRISSVVVDRGRWEVCEHARFEGKCVVLRRGSYDSLRALGMQDRISSVRKINNNRRYDSEIQPVAEVPDYQYRRRPNEAVYQAPVTSVHAVVGPPNERCWVERQQVQQNNPNVGGAILGGLIGGVLGHQVGGGSGKDLATGAGVVGGALLGANAGNRNGVATQDVRRCEQVANTTPAYWDVTYNYRGQQHRIQMATAPGATIPVNGRGEPRL
jgi:uncharacterized protein YcfJ